jgi:PAS domain S-box-containing protein
MPTGSLAPNRLSIRKRVVALLAVYAFLTAAVLAALLLYLRADAIASGQKVLAGFAEFANDQTAGTLKAIERTLSDAETALSAANTSGTIDIDQLQPQLEELLKDRPFLTSIQIIDRQGRIILGRTAADTGRDVSDRDYFIRQRERPGSALLWGAPIKARSNGEWLITATLPIRRANGEFDGLIVGTVPLAYFDEVWKVDNEVEGLMISLWRDDGMLLMRSPFDERVIGSSTEGGSLFARIRAGQVKGRFETVAAMDGVQRIVVFRRLDAYPTFVMSFAQSIDEALAPWWRTVWIVVAGWTIAAAMVGGLAIRVAREWNARLVLEERYRILFDANPSSMVVFNRDTLRFLAVNNSAVAQYGWSRDELLTMTIDDLYLPADLPTVTALRQQIMPGAGTLFTELRHQKKDGTIINVEANVRMIDFEGKPAFLSMARDVTARKAVEQNLALMESQYRGLLEAAPDAMVVVNQAGEIVLLNVQAEKQFGYRRDELLGQRVTNIIPEGFAERLVTDATRSAADALAQEIGTGIELSGKRKDGTDFPIEIMLSPLTSAEGVLLVTAAIRNISVRKAAEKNLTKVEDQYRGLLEAAPDAMVVVNQAGEIVLVNVQAETQFGYPRDELLGQKVTNIIPEGFAERLVTDATRSATDALAQEIGTGIELSGKRKDGAEFPIEIMLSPLKSADGILLVTAAIRNISVRKTAEKNLVQMEGQYRGLLEAAPDAMVVVNRAGEIVLLNVQAEKQFGYSRDELLGQKVTNIIPEGFAERLVTDATRSETDALAQEIGTGIELLGKRKDGAQFPIEIMLSPLTSAQGVLLVTAAIRNISVRKTGEEQLRQSQKMEAVGQLTGGIAHDFNNILFVILANTDALLEDESFSPSVADRLGQIDKAVQRAADLTRQLLAFSRKQPLRPQQTDLNDLVTDTGNLLRRSLGAQIEIDTALATDLGVVSVDRSQFETALVNLCLNARDAMPGGGRLLIETQNVILDEEYCIFNTGAVPGAYAMLSVTDAGAGIPAATLNKVFEPFFTTKEVGKGTGLGLSMVYGFIKQSNGHISIYSELGHGTTVKLFLPHSEGVVQELAADDKTPVPGGTERILVVEDEMQVRDNVVRQLRGLGYSVTEAPDGAAGLAAFEAASPPYDLLLSDVVMPGLLSGKLLAAEVARRWPRTRIVFMSGFTETSSVRHGRLDEGSLLLSKPFRKADLARMIRHALDVAPLPADLAPAA